MARGYIDWAVAVGTKRRPSLKNGKGTAMAEELIHRAGVGGDIAAETAVTALSPPGYELLDEIGHGGMGVVYRARDTALDRDVAVKLLSERYPPDFKTSRRLAYYSAAMIAQHTIPLQTELQRPKPL